MKPFAQVKNDEMFVTYADSEDDARRAFMNAGLPGTDPERLKTKSRIRVQPSRKASEFKYTRDGETVAATLVGDVPAEFRDYDPVDVVINIGEQPALVDASAE